MKVLNFGSLNLDYVYSVDHMVAPGETLTSAERNVFCGGKGLNQSIALAKAGADVYHAGQIGPEGQMLLDAMEEQGVKTHWVRKTEVPTGHAVIQVDKSGQNCILLYGGANRALTAEYIDQVLADFASGEMLLLQNEVNMLDYIIDTAYERGMTVVLNPSPFDSGLESCDLSKVSLFLLNEVEGAQLAGGSEPEEILKALREKYPDAKAVLTLGSEGSVYQYGDYTVWQSIYKVDAVDTTAAGDTFTGYFLAAVLEGQDVDKALDLAARASAIAVTRNGAAPSVPLRSEVEKYQFSL